MKLRNINTLLQAKGEINLTTRSSKSTRKKLKNRNGKLAKRSLRKQLNDY